MAHSFVQVHDDEMQAFEDFARARPDGVILLIDTYDTEAGARKVVALAPQAQGRRHRHPRRAHRQRRPHRDGAQGARHPRRRRIEGRHHSGQRRHQRRRAARHDAAKARRSTASASASTSTPRSTRPSLDCAYKLQEYAGKPRRKLSEGKATWPGRKQVWRAYDTRRPHARRHAVARDRQAAGETLIVPVMRGGKRIAPRRRSRKSANVPRASLRACPNRCAQLRAGRDFTGAVADALEGAESEKMDAVKRSR